MLPRSRSADTVISSSATASGASVMSSTVVWPGRISTPVTVFRPKPISWTQLQITPPRGGSPLPAPGGVLFLSWEASGSRPLA